MKRILCSHSRRFRVAWAAALAAVATLTPHAAPAQSTAGRNLIRQENQKPGTADWQLTYVRLDKSAPAGFRSHCIEGHCSRQSVAAGEPIDFYVSTEPEGQFTIEIFRMGYYGGLGARLMKTLGPLSGKTQPMPPVGTQPVPYQATIYPTAKGGFVFNASTIFWSMGLSVPPGHMPVWSHNTRPNGPDPRVQQITHNLLRRAIDR